MELIGFTAGLFFNTALLAAFYLITASIKARNYMPGWLLPVFVKAAALYECVLFALFVKSLLSHASSLRSISNHTVLTLDIIYLLSMLILVMFQIFKEPEALFCKKV